MAINTSAAEVDPKTLGMKHWLYQIVPPLLMLGLLFTTTSGTSLVFLAGIFILPVLFSLISIIARLIFFKTRKYYLVRPLLTVAIFSLILLIANWTYTMALDQAIAEARIIHQQCNEKLACPEKPDGWQIDGSRIGRNDLGFWLKYSASYSYDKQSLNIRVYRGPDIGEVITGGVSLPFEVSPYVEG